MLQYNDFLFFCFPGEEFAGLDQVFFHMAPQL